MLKHFLYLNNQSVDSYLSTLEDGLRGTAEERSSQTQVSEKSGEISSKSGVEKEQIQSRVDTPTARFERLQKSALADVELSGWIQVTDPEDELASIRTGHIIDIECEIYVPQVIQALSPKGGIGEAIGLMEGLAPYMESMGNDTTGMPSKTDLEMMKSVTGLLGGDLVVVGERDDTDWHVAGRLIEQYRAGEIEGIARVVGKVTTSWGQGRWKPLLSLPGMNVMSREQRREMERKKPTPNDEQNSLEGPAFMLDVLAIYR